MKNKKKLISLIAAFCLVLCLGVFGVLAVTELNLSIGGEIKFSATGVKATISDGRFVTGTDTSALTDYAGIWQVPSDAQTKLTGFAVTTQKASYDEELAKWSGLKLQFNEAGDSAYLYFTITNNATDDSKIVVTLTSTLPEEGENNFNTEIVLPTVADIAAGDPVPVFIEFKVTSKLMDANLKGFAVNIKLERKEFALDIDSTGSAVEGANASYSGATYTITDGQASVVANNPSGELVIANRVSQGGETYPVTSIPDNAFKESDSLTSIVVPKGITSIGDNAFSDCYELRSVSLPEGLTSIGASAFSNCFYLSSFNMPTTVRNIGNSAFSNCANLGLVNIPNGLTSIGDYTFSMCGSFSGTLTIPDSVTSIGKNAFWSCMSLTSIVIPKNVTSIGASAFEKCASLNSIIVDENNTVYKSTGNCLIHIESKTLITGSNTSVIPTDGSVEIIGRRAFCDHTSLSAITIPESVTTIESEAFMGCSSLTTLTIPSSVTSISNSAFDYSGLTSVILLANITNINNGLFYNCSQLKTITIPGSVTNIEKNAFAESLTSVTLLDGITTLDSDWFSGYKNLETIIIPASVTSIPANMLAGCTKLNSVVLSEGLKTIGKNAFKDCALTSISIPASVTSIETDAFEGCKSLTTLVVDENNATYKSVGNCLIHIPSKTLLKAFGECSIPSDGSVTSFASDAFAGSSITSITIPSNITSIPANMFADCANLTSVILPEGLTTIGENAFKNCGLTSIIIPASVTSIGANAFVNCPLQRVSFKAETPIDGLWETDLLYNMPYIYVPTDDAVTAYQNYLNWFGPPISKDASLAS